MTAVPAAATSTGTDGALTRLRRPPAGMPPGPHLPLAVQTALWLFAIEPFSRWCRHRYGDVFTVTLPMNGPVVQICHPDGVRQVFAAPPADARAGEANSVLEPLLGTRSVLLLDGPEHLRQRRLLLPAFHGDRLAGFTGVIEEVTRRELATWRPGSTMSLREAMQRITLDVILRTVFGAEEGPQLSELRGRLIALLDTRVQFAMLPGLHRDLGPWSPWGAFLRRRTAVDETVHALIAERRREVAAGGGEARGDILHTLLLARDDVGEGLTDAELRDELMTLLLAGHETTATALTWFFDLVLRDGEVLRRLREEIAEGASTAWLDACIRETLRVRPVVPVVARRLHAPLEVMGYTIPAGVAVAPNILRTHRSAAYDDPTAFRPDRFVDTRPDPAAWLPFGGGIRRCLGASFATLEMRVVATTILRHAELHPARRSPEGIRRRAVTLVPRHGGRVHVDRVRPAGDPAPG